MTDPGRETAPEFPGYPGERSGAGLDPQLLDDCRRILAHWTVQDLSRTPPVPPAGIRVPEISAASAHVVAGMSGYGS
jgi:hypothetical protein